jgi:hypothetical protein
VSRTGTNDLAARVARHFSEPEWFTTFEFPLYGAIETPDGKDRTIDALAISRISGRGNEVYGIEIKSERSDWLKELATPSKAEAFTPLLDRFYLVAAKDVATLDEVPSTWGFLEANGSGLRVVRRAPHLEATRRLRESGGEPIPREIWVRIIRRTLEGMGSEPKVEAAYRRGHAAGVQEVREEQRRTVEDREWRFRELVDTVLAFEKVSGIQLVETFKGRDGEPVYRSHGAYTGEQIGELVILARENRDLVRHAGQLVLSYERTMKDLRAALNAVGWKPPEPEKEM